MTAVIRLFFDSRPAAIVWGVGTIVVDAIKLMLRGGLAAHVGEKCGVVVPSLANFDAATSPVFIARGVRVIASTAKSTPCPPFWRFSTFSMFGFGLAVVLSCSFFMEASARLGVSSFQIIAKNNTFVSAIAATQEARISMSNICDGENDQTAEPLGYEIEHASIIIGRMQNV